MISGTNIGNLTYPYSNPFPFHFPMIANSELTYLNPKLMWKAHLSTRQARISDKSNFSLTFSQQIKYIEQANEKSFTS